MAKRKITVTVDEALVDAVQTLGSESLSAVVNHALATEVDRRARAAALGNLLAGWDDELGLVSAEAAEAARAFFDDLDAIGSTPPTGEPRERGRSSRSASRARKRTVA